MLKVSPNFSLLSSVACFAHLARVRRTAMSLSNLEQEFQTALKLDTSFQLPPTAPFKNKFSQSLINGSSGETPGTVVFIGIPALQYILGTMLVLPALADLLIDENV